MGRRMVSSADIQKILNVSHVAAVKRLKDIPYTLTRVDGSDRPVKMYEVEELPIGWRERMEERGDSERHAIQGPKSGGDSKKGVEQRGGDISRAASRQPSLFATDSPHIADPKRLTIDDKVAIIAYLNASPHQNNAIAALNCEYQELNLTKQRACAYKAALRKHGTKGLADNRGRPKEVIKADITLIKQAIYASGTTHVSSGFHCYCLFYCRRKGVEFDHFAPKSDISDSTFRRAVERLKKQDKQIGAFLRVGKDGIKDLYPELKRHWNRVNQEWQVDATRLDFFVFKNGEKVRPMVVAIVDCYSGARVWGMYDSATSLSDVRLLKKAIKSFGIPELIRGDNGADYLSAHFQGVLSALGIGYHAAQAGKGRQKGKIERSFGSVQHSWLENLPGFVGHNVKERAALEAQEVEKLKKLNGAKTNVKCLEWGTMQSVLDEYLAARMESSGAAQKYRLARERGEIKSVENIDRYLGKAVEPIVSAKGAQAFGRIYGGHEFWMCVYIGQKVTLREDIDDVSHAYIFGQDGGYMCEAMDNSFVSISAEEAREIMARHKAEYINPAKRMIKASQEAKDYEYEELAKLIAGEIKEIGKTKLEKKLKTESKAATNKPTPKPKEEQKTTVERMFENPVEMFEAAIKEGWEDTPRVLKLKVKMPDLYELALERVRMVG